MSAPEVVIYTTPLCGYCWRAKKLLGEKGVSFHEIDVTDPAARAAMRERAYGRNTVPQIFVGQHHVGGYMELMTLNASGRLDPLLAGKVSPP